MANPKSSRVLGEDVAVRGDGSVSPRSADEHKSEPLRHPQQQQLEAQHQQQHENQEQRQLQEQQRDQQQRGRHSQQQQRPDEGSGPAAAAGGFSEDDFPPPPGFRAKPPAARAEREASLGCWSTRTSPASTWLAAATAARPAADSSKGYAGGDVHAAGQAWKRSGPAERWPHAGGGPRRGAAGPAFAWVPKDTVEPGAKIKVPQSVVGLVIGKQGKVLQGIKDETGAVVEVDQSTKDRGFSTVHVRKGAGATRAVELVQALLRRAGPEGAAGGDGQLESAELEVEQRLVGSLIGKSGETINRIKEESGAFVGFKQDNSWQGYSTLRISGRPECVERAKTIVDAKLAELRGGGDGSEELELRVEQRFVGSLIGRAGETVLDIKAQSGANVQFDQENAWRGYSMLRVSGSRACVQRARALIDAKLAELKGGEEPRPRASDGGRGPRDGDEETMELLVEQRFVGLLIGRNGETITGLKEASGASVSFDREPPHKGFGLLRVSGRADRVAKACALVDEKLAKFREDAAAAPARAGQGADADTPMEELKIDQRMVRHLIGTGGDTCRGIETESGARLNIDQGTRELGYSTLEIRGSTEAIRHARRLVSDRLADAEAAAAAAAGGAAAGTLENPAVTESGVTFRIQQCYVGALIGKGGDGLQSIRKESGASVDVDQRTNDWCYSVVHMKASGEGSAERAFELIAARIAHANAARAVRRADGFAERRRKSDAEPHPAPTDHMTIDVKHVGLIIGRGRETIRRIAEESGAELWFEDACKSDFGVRTLAFAGGAKAVELAKALVEERIVDATTRPPLTDDSRCASRDEAWDSLWEQQAMAESIEKARTVTSEGVVEREVHHEQSPLVGAASGAGATTCAGREVEVTEAGVAVCDSWEDDVVPACPPRRPAAEEEQPKHRSKVDMWAEALRAVWTDTPSKAAAIVRGGREAINAAGAAGSASAALAPGAGTVAGSAAAAPPPGDEEKLASPPVVAESSSRADAAPPSRPRTASVAVLEAETVSAGGTGAAPKTCSAGDDASMPDVVAPEDGSSSSLSEAVLTPMPLCSPFESTPWVNSPMPSPRRAASPMRDEGPVVPPPAFGAGDADAAAGVIGAPFAPAGASTFVDAVGVEWAPVAVTVTSGMYDGVAGDDADAAAAAANWVGGWDWFGDASWPVGDDDWAWPATSQLWCEDHSGWGGAGGGGDGAAWRGEGWPEWGSCRPAAGAARNRCGSAPWVAAEEWPALRRRAGQRSHRSVSPSCAVRGSTDAGERTERSFRWVKDELGAAGSADAAGVAPMKVEQRLVGWLIGRNGASIKEISYFSGSIVQVDQSTSGQGFSSVTFSGPQYAVATARALVEQRLREAQASAATAGGSGAWGGAAGRWPAQRPHATESAYRRGRTWSPQPTALPLSDPRGWSDGEARSRKAGRPRSSSWRQASSGSDDREDDDGGSDEETTYSRARSFSRCAVPASVLEETDDDTADSDGGSRPRARLQDEAECREDMEVKQRMVGWVIGRNGASIKEICWQSGASVRVDQSTSEQGFSTLHMVGPKSAVGMARRLVAQKLAAADSQQQAWGSQPWGSQSWSSCGGWEDRRRASASPAPGRRSGGAGYEGAGAARGAMSGFPRIMRAVLSALMGKWYNDTGSGELQICEIRMALAATETGCAKLACKAWVDGAFAGERPLRVEGRDIFLGLRERLYMDCITEKSVVWCCERCPDRRQRWTRTPPQPAAGPGARGDGVAPFGLRAPGHGAAVFRSRGCREYADDVDIFSGSDLESEFPVLRAARSASEDSSSARDGRRLAAPRPPPRRQRSREPARVVVASSVGLSRFQ